MLSRLKIISFASSRMSTIKIYTKTGDKGTSSLYTGERRPKDDILFETLGTVDELSSMLGLAREYTAEIQKQEAEKVKLQLESIQCRLQDVNSCIATPKTSQNQFKLEKTRFDPEGEETKNLEHWIDAMDEVLPPLKNFILPSGGKASSTLHVCRSICRRAERRVVPLIREEAVDHSCGIYLNRLSDYLFDAARYLSYLEGKPETIYKK